MKNVLLGVVCLDIYTHTGQIHPGCGIFHNAYHLQQLGVDPLLITRIGQTRSEIFLEFFRRNRISILPDNIITAGEPATIEIALQESGEAVMANFRPGVWQNFRLTPTEAQILAQAVNVHTVLVGEVIPEFIRIASDSILSKALVSADFLDFGYFSPDHLARLLNCLDIAFIGWKGELADPTIAAIEQMVKAQPALVVVTLGSRGVQIFDSLTAAQYQARFFEVEKIPVRQNTNGCGDAFIAYFLAEYWRSRNLEQAVGQGKIGGAKATQWQFALPDSAYGM